MNDQGTMTAQAFLALAINGRYNGLHLIQPRQEPFFYLFRSRKTNVGFAGKRTIYILSEFSS
jgi:hypothetical protein